MIGVGVGAARNETARRVEADQGNVSVNPINSLTGKSGTSYISTASSYTAGATIYANNWIPNATQPQIKVNQGNTTSLSASNFFLYNSTAFSDHITKITVTFSTSVTKNYFQIHTSSSTPLSSNQSFDTSKAGSLVSGNQYKWEYAYNSGIDYFRFGCAKNGGTVKISEFTVYYGQNNVPALSFSEESINGEVGDDFSFEWIESNLNDEITWSPANNETDVIDYSVDTENKTVSGTLTGAGQVTLTGTSGSASDSVTITSTVHENHRKFTIETTSSVTEEGDAITGAEVTFSNNYSTKEQLIANKEMVLTISNLEKRVNVNKLVFSMRSNSSSGEGYITISIDGEEEYLAGDSSGVGFNQFGDNTRFDTTYKPVTWEGLSYSAIDSIVITIHATVNSLYCQWFDVYFEEEEIVDTVTALSVTPNTWVGYDSQTINVANYTVSVTKNDAEGTASDYTFQGIGSGEGNNFQPRVANFTSGHPALTDTRLQWKANYPTEVGGSTYLYAYVSLSVSEDTAVSVALSGNMSKTTYLSTENWDKTGLVVTATYASSAEANVTADSSFKFYSDADMTNELAAPADLGFGENKTVYIKATYSGLSNVEAYEQTVNVSKAISVTFVAGTDVGSVNELSKNGITILAAASESDFSRNDNYRIYAGKNVTISASRENIVKIEFISNSEANNTLSGEGLAKNGATSIWTGDADSVTLTAEGSQARFTKIIVTLDSVKYSIESTLKTKTSLSYATYTHHDDGTYTYTDVAIRFGGKIAPALWDSLNAESTIEGYGVLLATSDLGTDSIENWYNAYKTESNTVDEALAELVTDGVVAKYSKSVEEKTHPTQVGDVYSWNLYYRIGNTKAELLEEYTAVAYIKIHNSIVFLQQDTVSAKSLASDMLQGENPETYGGSLSYLAELQEGE